MFIKMQRGLSLRASASGFRRDKAVQTLACKFELELVPGDGFLLITILQGRLAYLHDRQTTWKQKRRECNQGVLFLGPSAVQLQ